jgi:hypothetical protein
VDFTRPDGAVTRVEREIFGAAGKSRRSRNAPLTAAELDASAAASGLVTDRLFDLFFSTGATEIAQAQRKTVLSIDLRHLRSAAVPAPESKSNVFRSNMLRGVLNTHLEHLLLEQLLADAPTRGRQWARADSAATVFDRARAATERFALYAAGSSVLPVDLPDDTAARLREDIEKGLLAIAPASQVTSADATRYAWWRVDPASGETIGVLDNGLHGAQTVEYQLVRNQNNTKVVGARVWEVSANGTRTLTHAEVFQVGGQRIVDFMRDMAIIGARRLPSLVIP